MKKVLKIKSNHDLQAILGKHDENIKLIEENFGAKIVANHSGLKIIGSEKNVEKTNQLLKLFLEKSRKGEEISKQDLYHLIKASKDNKISDLRDFSEEKIEVAAKNVYVSPKTKGQQEYIEAIKNYDIVFGIGPAGTGKTYLAMAMSVSALRKGIVRRIILTRPAIEAGESLGYLPGDMIDKISPYLRPLYDALYDMMEAERIEKYLEMGIIEVAPLAYMRGRTLNDAFIVLDEAQNCTAEQMKMFLTRLGFDSKTVITGDITQSDLPEGKPVGLIQAREILKDIEGIKFAQLTGDDVVRHELVQQIIEAYSRIKNNEKKISNS
ncbi:MAG: PhoH family protein [Candidatus Omnitrophota bacterium]